MTLDGRRVLVVGGGTRPSPEPDPPPGNGRATAVACAREGADVALVDLDLAAAEQTAELVRAEGRKAWALQADVANAEACARMLGQAHEAMGGLDGLVLNVGIGLGGGLEHTSAEQWDTVFAVNVRSHFLAIQAAMPVMTDGGSIVLVSSLAGLKPGSRLPAYDASKAAQFGLARHAAIEGARRGIRVNTVAPGLIDTPLGRVATAGRPSRGTTRIPLGRQGTAWEVADAIVFLLGSRSSYITGQVLTVDGGLSTLA